MILPHSPSLTGPGCDLRPGFGLFWFAEGRLDGVYAMPRVGKSLFVPMT